MQRWQQIRLISAVTLFVSLLLLMWFSSQIWISLLLAVLFVVCSVCIFLTYKEERRQLQTIKEQLIIDLVSHYRHDWMNDIQLLFGYVSLKKYDKLDDCMDKIRNKALQESCVAKLGIPSLVAFFITFRLHYTMFDLELEMDQDINLAALPLDTVKVSKFVQDMVKLFHSHALLSDEEPNVLSLQFDLEEDALLFDLIYQGGFNAKALQNALIAINESYTVQFARLEQEYTANKAVVTIRLPFCK
ncbi:MAG: putative sporulation initiation phosphotransferase [Bacilli bacterium]|jgi:stage 0 sporulation protein B (sporulation initiation phosphotransferase)|nr:putative sporulation initiation phosphotransferase [Bacilli bacterium]